MTNKVLDTVPEEERVRSAFAAHNMGYARMLDVRALTVKIKDDSSDWSDVKQRLPLLSQKPYYNKLTYGYVRGHEVYAYTEDIRKYQISLVGCLQEKEKQALETQQLAQDYPTMTPAELLGKEKFPLSAFLS